MSHCPHGVDYEVICVECKPAGGNPTDGVYLYPQMTTRDRLAMAALPALVTIYCPEVKSGNAGCLVVAMKAYQLADAMMKVSNE